MDHSIDMVKSSWPVHGQFTIASEKLIKVKTTQVMHDKMLLLNSYHLLSLNVLNPHIKQQTNEKEVW